MNEQEGSIITNIWTDIQPLHDVAAERLGYPTQKPLALLERIIQASSNPGDLVLDPFAGCGTTIAAAQKSGRRWIGIDITHLAVALQRYRLEQMFPGITFTVVGEPTALSDAQHLAEQDRYQFQWWALSLVRARPIGGDVGGKGKKGADKGIDGLITFIDDSSGKPKQIIIQVKSGHVNAAHIRDLRGAVEREKAAIGVYITLEPPTGPMTLEALEAGQYTSPGWGKDYPKIQILTIEALLGGATIQMPPTERGTFKQAQKVEEEKGVQGKLL